MGRLPWNWSSSVLCGSQAVRFRIASGVPSITDMTLVAEVFRQAVLSRAGVVNGFYNIPPVLSGKGKYQTVRLRSHEHAHYLCEPELNSGSLTHLFLFIQGGIDPELLPILGTIPKLWAPQVGDMKIEPDDNDPSKCSKLLSYAREWTSVTPFMLGRHPRIRRSERHSREDYEAALERELDIQVRNELAVRGLPEPVLVEFDRSMGVKLRNCFLPWGDFKRERSGDAEGPAVRYGHGFRLVFRKPVRGPIVLGYGCHFGLGMFLPSRMLEL